MPTGGCVPLPRGFACLRERTRQHYLNCSMYLWWCAFQATTSAEIRSLAYLGLGLGRRRRPGRGPGRGPRRGPGRVRHLSHGRQAAQALEEVGRGPAAAAARLQLLDQPSGEPVDGVLHGEVEVLIGRGTVPALDAQGHVQGGGRARDARTLQAAPRLEHGLVGHLGVVQGHPVRPVHARKEVEHHAAEQPLRVGVHRGVPREFSLERDDLPRHDVLQRVVAVGPDVARLARGALVPQGASHVAGEHGFDPRRAARAVVGKEHPVDDVHDAVAREEVRKDDVDAVHPDARRRLGHPNGSSVEGRDPKVIMQ